MKKKPLSLLLTLAMLLSLVPAFGTLASATQTAVSYRYPVYNNTTAETAYERAASGINDWYTGTIGGTSGSTYTEIANSGATTWSTGWYVVPANTEVTISGYVVVSGDVNLVLCDGCTLTVTGDSNLMQPGILVCGSNSLTIYAQSDGNRMGTLSVTGGGTGGAAIGGGYGGRDGNNITINGGNITATGRSCGAGIGGGIDGSGSDITINGGVVTAKGHMSAGIGGGSQDKNGSNIVINGGTVTANGGIASAGIGGCRYGSGVNITITGGTVTANGGNMSAGIGGGSYGSGNNITITGGTVAAYGCTGAAGIGGGENGSASHITITGGTVTAYGVYEGYGIFNYNAIGRGRWGGASCYITIPDTMLILAGSDENNTSEIADSNGDGDLASELNYKVYAHIRLCPPCTIVGGADYQSIAAALSAAGTNPTTIRMYQNLTENVTIASGQNITLDLNGRVLKSAVALASKDVSGSVITNNGTLYITDSDTTRMTYGSTTTQHTRYFTDEKCAHGVVIGEECVSCGTCEHGNGLGEYCSSCREQLDEISEVPNNRVAKRDGSFETYSTIQPNGVEGVDYLKVTGGCITGGTGTYYDSSCCGGGGIYSLCGNVYLQAGNIIGNAAITGGGVYGSAAKVEISGGNVIGNSAVSTGGVFLKPMGGSLTISSGKISYNTAKYNGGAAGGDQFTMTGGEVSMNTSLEGRSGGVEVDVGQFIMTGGRIYGNKAGKQGGGVFTNFPITVGGNASITGNTLTDGTASNLCLFVNSINTMQIPVVQSRTITVNNGFTGSVGVSVENFYGWNSDPTPYPQIITTALDKDYSSRFTSDNESYRVKFDTDHLVLVKAAESSISTDKPAEGSITFNNQTVEDTNGIADKLTCNTEIAKKGNDIDDKVANATRLQVQIKSIDFATSGKTTVKTAKFDVKAMNGDTPVASYSTTNVTFRLPVYAVDADAYKSAMVYNGTTILKATKIKGSGDNQYIEITAPTFTSANSEYSYELSKVDLGAVETTQFFASLTVRENIDINLYIKPASAAEANKYSVKATFNGVTTNYQLSPAFYNVNYGCRIVVANVYSYEMTKPVHAEMYYTDENGTILIKTIDYSVRDYFMQQLEHDSSMYDYYQDTLANRKALYISALDYGTEAQKYFNGKTYGDGVSYDVNYSSLANAGTSAYGSYRSPATAINVSNPVSVTNHLSGVLLYPSIIHGSETELMFYIDGVQCSSLDEFNQKYSVTCDGVSMSNTLKYESTNRVSVRITNIMANNLGRNYRLLIQQLGSGNEDNYFELKYSVVAAMKNISDSGKDVALNLALYKYGLAAAILWGETPAWFNN